MDTGIFFNTQIFFHGIIFFNTSDIYCPRTRAQTATVAQMHQHMKGMIHL
jgi:hypothetical protein